MLQDSPQSGNTEGLSDLGTELANSATAGCKSYKQVGAFLPTFKELSSRVCADEARIM